MATASSKIQSSQRFASLLTTYCCTCNRGVSRPLLQAWRLSQLVVEWQYVPRRGGHQLYVMVSLDYSDYSDQSYAVLKVWNAPGLTLIVLLFLYKISIAEHVMKESPALPCLSSICRMSRSSSRTWASSSILAWRCSKIAGFTMPKDVGLLAVIINTKPAVIGIQRDCRSSRWNLFNRK